MSECTIDDLRDLWLRELQHQLDDLVTDMELGRIQVWDFDSSLIDRLRSVLGKGGKGNE